MHIVLCSLLRYFTWSLKQWSDVYIKTKISKTGSNHFCSTVVTVLPDLRNKNARPASVFFRKAVRKLLHFFQLFFVFHRTRIYTRNCLNTCFVPAEHFF